MDSNFAISCLIVGLLAMVFFTPVWMAKGIYNIADDKFSPVLLVPVLNIALAEKKYYGHVYFATISNILLIVGAVARYNIWRYMYDNRVLGTISYFAFFAILAFLFIGNGKFVYDVLHDSNAAYGWKFALMVIIYPIGQYYVGSFVVNVIKHNISVEKEFNESDY